MTLFTSIREDLKMHIINAYGEKVENINKFLELAEQNDSYGKITNTHFTSSIVVIDQKVESILLLHHKKYNKWLPFGGHWNDSGYKQETILQGAIREMYEEAFANEQIQFSVLNNSHPIDLDIHEAAEHTHYDLAFLVAIDKEQPFTLSTEAKEIAWIHMANIIDNRHNLFPSRLVRIAEKIRESVVSNHIETKSF